jgi:PAS domain-containing protein
MTQKQLEVAQQITHVGSWQAVVSGGRFWYPERILRPDGSIRELATIGEAVLDERKNVIGLVGTCRDVTEERALDDRARVYADIVQHLQIALAVFKVDVVGDPSTYTLAAFNPAAERLLGMSLADRIGASLPETLPELIRRKKYMASHTIVH